MIKEFKVGNHYRWIGNDDITFLDSGKHMKFILDRKLHLCTYVDKITKGSGGRNCQRAQFNDDQNTYFYWYDFDKFEEVDLKEMLKLWDAL